MFSSRFARKPTTSLNRSVSFNTNEQNGRYTNMATRTCRQAGPGIHGNNTESQECIHSSQHQQYTSTSTLPRKNPESPRSGGSPGVPRRLATGGTWKRQPFVRRADNSPVYTRNNVRNGYSNRLRLQPSVIGTNPLSKAVPDTPPSRSNQRCPSNASEQFSELSSSFCYITQGNIAKSVEPEDSRQYEFAAFSQEPNIAMTDFCAYCLNRQKCSIATHHCGTCGPYGRYLCQKCLAPHNEFTENHTVKSLSGQIYRNQDETKKTEEKPKETTDETKKGKHPRYIRDVSLKTEEDNQSCQITGFCQLENGTIVLTEMNNKTIKTLDGTYQVKSTVHLLSYPMDVCCIGKCEVLVVLYKCTVQYANIDDDNTIVLTQKKELKHDCVCLAWCNNKIFIGSSKSLYIYNKNWTKLDEITNELFGDERIFSDQFSIAVSEHDGVTIVYVADENTGMFAIEITGHELTTTWKFKDSNMFKASGLCFDSTGNVLLSDRGSERLIKMNAEGMILAILLDTTSGIQPLNMPFYDKKNEHLIIALSGQDNIKVFDFN